MPTSAGAQVTNLHRTLASHTGWLNTSRALTAEDLQGRIILLDFWTFCCINCMHVIPDLQYLEKTFGDDLTVIGVHSAKFKNEQDSENIRSAILRYGIHHPVVNDFDFAIWEKFGVRAWPTFVLINPKGIIEQVYSGEGNREKIARDVAALIKKYDGKINKNALPLALEKDKQPESILSFPSKIKAYPTFPGPHTALLISDSGHHRIVVAALDGNSALITDQIGSGTEGFKDGSFETAQFRRPQGILVSRDNNTLVYIADTENHALRVADFRARTVTTLAGTGKQGHAYQAKNAPALSTPLASPWDLALYPDDKHIVIAMAGTHQLWSYAIDKKTVSVIAGNGRESIDDGPYPNNSLSQPSGLSAYGDKLYFVDSETSSLRVYDGKEIKTLIGTGLFDFGYKEGKQGEARMQHPLGVDADKNNVYVADSYNHSIRRYNLETGVLSNFAGHGMRGNKDSALAEAEFNEPNDIEHIDGKDWVADTNNNAIRIIDNGKVSTLAVSETKNSAVEYSDALPNAEKLPAQSVTAGGNITINLTKGWHINDEAPSYLALFDAGKKPVASFDLAAIKTRNVTLPALSEGSYRLQGTLYYCEDKAGSQCLLKSIEGDVKVSKTGAPALSIKLN